MIVIGKEFNYSNGDSVWKISTRRNSPGHLISNYEMLLVQLDLWL